MNLTFCGLASIGLFSVIVIGCGTILGMEYLMVGFDIMPGTSVVLVSTYTTHLESLVLKPPVGHLCSTIGSREVARKA